MQDIFLSRYCSCFEAASFSSRLADALLRSVMGGQAAALQAESESFSPMAGISTLSGSEQLNLTLQHCKQILPAVVSSIVDSLSAAQVALPACRSDCRGRVLAWTRAAAV